MTTTAKERKGSALLIVLGMMAFMIVSAVAFSAYMRFARTPSSFLRRSAAARELTKAALARAIDEVDFAVANNPYPGLGTESASGVKHNFFKNHVFIGTNQLLSVDRMLEDTTAVMSLEGLAYVPPPLVNEARYFGRRTPTAGWRNFKFDAGRYAYIALDVSDFFDVNRVRADAPRSSASNSRISLAYLFESAGHTGSGSGASEWDKMVDKTGCTFNQDTLEREYKSGVPLVSVADMNLLMGSSSYGLLFSPWYKYVKNGTSGSGFYGTTDAVELDDSVGRMTFVTDGYFPQPYSASGATEDDDYDLTDGDKQPFKMEDLEQKTPSLLSVIDYSSKGVTRLFESICGLGMCALWDYLDRDHVPVSLAVPTLERTPMVCGIKSTFTDAKFKVEKTATEQQAEPDGGPAEGVVWKHKRLYQFKIDGAQFGQGIMGGRIDPLIVYPFCRDDGTKEETYKLDGHLAIFFSNGELRLRTSANDVLHFGAFKDLTQPKIDANGVIMIPFGQDKSVSFTAKSIKEEKDAVKDTISCPLSSVAQFIAPTMNNTALLEVTYEWEQKAVSDDSGFNWRWDPQTEYSDRMPPAESMTKAHCGFPPLRADGTPDPNIANDNNLLGALKGGGAAGKMRLDFALWLGIKNSENKYVDLVPACIKDDDDLNGANSYSFMGPSGNKIAGRPYPLLLLQTGINFDLSFEGLEAIAGDAAGKDINPSPAKMVVADPRFNHAPEDWYIPSWEINAQNWIDNAVHKYANDVFLNTSDQGYMQSVYELAFIPRLTNMKSYGADKMQGDYSEPDDNRSAIGNGQEGEGQARHHNLMWKSYDPLGDDASSFEEAGFVSSGNGVKVNPYSATTNVLMAAFANTPLDWHCAATNCYEEGGEDFATMKASEFNAKYAWNEYSSGGMIAYDDLVAIAGKFMNLICSNRVEPDVESVFEHALQNNWEDAWHNMGWNSDSEDTLAGVQLGGNTDDLWDIDRKFLYGYWRDCFESKQQLFLVFVRAEPTMLGGGSQNSIPPQLGGRAVALVWRDPTANTIGGTYSGYPHRTRILFYKPLE